MMIHTLKRLIPTTFLAFGAFACGGGGPDLNKVKQDFDHPSGSTKDQQGLIAVTGKESTLSSNAGASLAAGAPGLGLTAEGIDQDGFAEIAPSRVFASQIHMMQGLALDERSFGVSDGTSSKTANCFLNSDLIAKSSQAQSDYSKNGKASFSASYTVDLGSCQLDHPMSGKIDIDLKAEADKSSGTFTYTVKYDFHNVCDSASGACLNGGFALEESINERAASTGIGYTSGSVNLIEAWDYTADVKNKTGGTDTIAMKGGLRLKANGDQSGAGAGTFEYLFYVHDSHGNEVSYVLKISAMTGGDTTLEIRGSDGSITCVQHPDLSGSCNGTDKNGQPFSIMWTQNDYSGVTKSDNFKKK